MQIQNYTCYYEITNISSYVDIDPETILRLSTKMGITEKINKKLTIKRDNLPAFFEKLYEGSHINRVYNLPGWLKNSQEKWCLTLNELYQNQISHPASVSPQQGEFLRSIVVNENPKVMVEIGTFIGISTVWIGSAIKDSNKKAKLYSIDLFADIMPWKNQRTRCLIETRNFVSKKIEQADLEDIVVLIEGNSVEIGKKWDKITNEKIDILYIDGDHSIKGCINDFNAFLPYLNPDGLIILHDIFPKFCGCEGPRYLLDNISTDFPLQKFELKTSPCNFGMAVLRFSPK